MICNTDLFCTGAMHGSIANAVRYRHALQKDVMSTLSNAALTDSSYHTCSRRHPHWPIRSEWPTATALPTLHGM